MCCYRAGAGQQQDRNSIRVWMVQYTQLVKIYLQYEHIWGITGEASFCTKIGKLRENREMAGNCAKIGNMPQNIGMWGVYQEVFV